MDWLGKDLIKKIIIGSSMLWAVSVSLFFSLAIILSTPSGTYSESQSQIFLWIFIIGVISFISAGLFFMIFLFRKRHNHDKQVKKTEQIKINLSSSSFLIILILIIAIAFLLGKTNVLNLEGKNQQQLTPTPTGYLESTLNSASTGTNNSSENNSDPITSCVSTHPNCKGRTIKARLSQCQYIYCCVYPDKAVLLSDKSQCISSSTQNNKSNSSLVRCPDGYGGYINESQAACKSRWDKISQDLASGVKAYNAALLEQQRLQYLQLQINNTYQEAQRQERMNEINTNVPIPTYNPYIDFKIIVPTPTPCPKTSTGETIDYPGSPC